MSDLISRQAAIDKFEPWLKVRGYSEGELNMLKAVLYELRFLPSAESERKKGRWIRHTTHSLRSLNGHRECSVCHVWLEWDMPRNSYCPNCGADMRGEKE